MTPREMIQALLSELDRCTYVIKRDFRTDKEVRCESPATRRAIYEDQHGDPDLSRIGGMVCDQHTASNIQSTGTRFEDLSRATLVREAMLEVKFVYDPED